MTTSKISAFIFALTALGIVSCNKDFLDRQPLSNITPENYLVEESQLAAYTIARYNVLPTFAQGGYGTFGNDIHTDNMAFMNYDNRYVPGQWRVQPTGGDWSFTEIFQANYFLNTVLPRYNAGEITGNPATIAHYVGEMYFLRAWTYFSKLQALGDFPIVKTVLPDDRAILTAASERAPRTEVARFILSDLDSAAMLMLPVSPDGNKNRLSSVCAKLLKSRVALYEASWLENFKGTAFVPKGPGWPGADKAYNANYEFRSGNIDSEIDFLLDQAMASSKEVADMVPLVPNTMVDQSQTTYEDFAQASSTNPYTAMFGSLDLKGFSEVLLWRRYDRGLSLGHNAVLYAGGGNYASGLTRGMVDAFLMKNGLPIYASGSGYIGDEELKDVRTNRDGRLWLFLKEPGQLNMLKTSVVPIPYPIEPVPRILDVSFETKYSTGYSIRKGINYDAAEVQVYYGGSTGSIVFRGVEAYLNYIEASYLKTGALNGTAIAYWQAIRQRAGVDPDIQKTIDATDMTIEAKNDWGTYTAGTMVDKTLYNIRRERRSELIAEGMRYMDLRRWRAMDQMISTPYHIEGFKLWGSMQDWYAPASLTYDIGDASTVSSPARSLYFRPYEKTATSLAYDGYRWHMAHYLNPISTQHFLITADNEDVSTSPIYQNPGWPILPNLGPL